MGRRQWSFAFHASTFLSVICGAIAAVLPQLKNVEASLSDATTTLAAAGVLLLSLNTAGSFRTKWRANRISKGKAEQLIGELIGRDPTMEDIHRLNQIEIDHDKLLLGE
jgi:hypothetical protein